MVDPGGMRFSLFDASYNTRSQTEIMDNRVESFIEQPKESARLVPKGGE